MTHGHQFAVRVAERLFGKAWREERIVLYEDSKLAWFKQKGRLEPDGSLVLKEAPSVSRRYATGDAQICPVAVSLCSSWHSVVAGETKYIGRWLSRGMKSSKSDRTF